MLPSSGYLNLVQVDAVVVATVTITIKHHDMQHGGEA